MFNKLNVFFLVFVLFPICNLFSFSYSNVSEQDEGKLKQENVSVCKLEDHFVKKENSLPPPFSKQLDAFLCEDKGHLPDFIEYYCKQNYYMIQSRVYPQLLVLNKKEEDVVDSSSFTKPEDDYETVNEEQFEEQIDFEEVIVEVDNAFDLELLSVEANDCITEEDEKLDKQSKQYNDSYVVESYELYDNGEVCVAYSFSKRPKLKSFMSYKKLTRCRQKDLQDVAETTSDGIRMYDGRYCIAIGTHFGTQIGQYVSLVLENGNRIDCIVSDVKADKDTDKENIFTMNGCCSEFVVDTSLLPSYAKTRGDVSYAREEWGSPVVGIKVYDTVANF